MHSQSLIGLFLIDGSFILNQLFELLMQFQSFIFLQYGNGFFYELATIFIYFLLILEPLQVYWLSKLCQIFDQVTFSFKLSVFQQSGVIVMEVKGIEQFICQVSSIIMLYRKFQCLLLNLTTSQLVRCKVFLLLTKFKLSIQIPHKLAQTNFFILCQFLNIKFYNKDLSLSIMSFYKADSPSKPQSSFHLLILQTLKMLLTKIIQLTHHINQMPTKEVSQTKTNATLINIHQRKSISSIRKNDSNITNIRNDFEGLLKKVQDYKNSSPILMKNNKQISSQVSKISNSFQYEETELNIMRVQQGFNKQLRDVKQKVITLEEDIGQMLLLYKDLICDR